jgi:hypothetical protein
MPGERPGEIDDVAREMTGGAPAGGVRARVMARIAAPPPPRWRSAWVWVPIGAAAAVGLAIYLMPGTYPMPGTGPRSAAPSIVQAPRQVEAPPAQAGSDRDRPPAFEEPDRAAPPAVVDVGSQGPEWPGLSPTAVAAFAPVRMEFEPAPLELSRLDVPELGASGELAIDPVVVAALDPIAPIAITPLNDEGDGP